MHMRRNTIVWWRYTPRCDSGHDRDRRPRAGMSSGNSASRNLDDTEPQSAVGDGTPAALPAQPHRQAPLNAASDLLVTQRVQVLAMLLAVNIVGGDQKRRADWQHKTNDDVRPGKAHDHLAAIERVLRHVWCIEARS